MSFSNLNSTNTSSTSNAFCKLILPSNEVVKSRVESAFGFLQKMTFMSVREQFVKDTRKVCMTQPFIKSTFAKKMQPFINTPSMPAVLADMDQLEEDEDNAEITDFQRSVKKQILATYFTGAVAFFNDPKDYADMFKYKEEDFKNKCLLTDNQIAQNFFGIVAYADLDFLNPDKLPSIALITKFLQIIFMTATEVFPTASCYDMSVSACMPKIKVKTKLTNKGKTKEKQELISWGVHVVFPGIVTSCDDLRTFLKILSFRTSSISPKFEEVIDVNTVHATSASLRPNGSHKAVRCTLCNNIKKAPNGLDRFGMARPPLMEWDRINRAKYGSTTEDICDGFTKNSESSCPNRCFRGKKTPAGTYRQMLRVIDRGIPVSGAETSSNSSPDIDAENRFEILTFVDTEHLQLRKKNSKIPPSKEELQYALKPFERPMSPFVTAKELQQTSISPRRAVPFSKRVRAVPTVDMPHGLNPITRDPDLRGLMFEGDKKNFLSCVDQKTGLVNVTSTKNQKMYKTLASMLMKKFPKYFNNYSRISALRLCTDPKKLFAVINIKGQNCTTCPFNAVEAGSSNPNPVESNPIDSFRLASTPLAHKSSNIYFVAFFGKSNQRIEIRCYMEKCKPIHKSMSKFYFPSKRQKTGQVINVSHVCNMLNEMEVDLLRSMTNVFVERLGSNSNTGSVPATAFSGPGGLQSASRSPNHMKRKICDTDWANKVEVNDCLLSMSSSDKIKQQKPKAGAVVQKVSNVLSMLQNKEV
jgi:hypothetical protein